MGGGRGGEKVQTSYDRLACQTIILKGDEEIKIKGVEG